MDPFIIVKNYRQQRQALLEETHTPAPRIFLAELDANSLVRRESQAKRRPMVNEEDK
jgi:hypothetical protein